MSSDILKVSGIILRKTEYGENDWIFDLFAENGEVLGFLAKGAKNPKSKLNGYINIGNYIDITYDKGRNLNYPREINIQPKNIYKFYSQNIKNLYFFSDIIAITRYISKDFASKELFEILKITLHKADKKKENLDILYNYFLEQVIEITGNKVSLECDISGQTINDKEFYYHPESNKVFSKEKKPLSLDLPKIQFDDIFYKNYLIKKLVETTNLKIRLKF
jgi:DNA repair protein RecO (recombination protein O)